MRRRTVAAGTLLVLLVAGCSSEPPQSSPPPSRTPTTSAAPTTQPQPTRPTDTGTALPAWANVLRQPVDGQHLVTRQRKYVVTRGSDEAGTTTIADRTSKKVVVRHVPASGTRGRSTPVFALGGKLEFAARG